MFPNLNTELERNRLSKRDLAKAINKSEKSITNKFNGTTEFDLAEIKAIARLFPYCSLEYLFAIDETDETA